MKIFGIKIYTHESQGLNTFGVIDLWKIWYSKYFPCESLPRRHRANMLKYEQWFLNCYHKQMKNPRPNASLAEEVSVLFFQFNSMQLCWSWSLLTGIGRVLVWSYWVSPFWLIFSLRLCLRWAEEQENSDIFSDKARGFPYFTIYLLLDQL